MEDLKELLGFEVCPICENECYTVKDQFITVTDLTSGVYWLEKRACCRNCSASELVITRNNKIVCR